MSHWWEWGSGENDPTMKPVGGLGEPGTATGNAFGGLTPEQIAALPQWLKDPWWTGLVPVIDAADEIGKARDTLHDVVINLAIIVGAGLVGYYLLVRR